MSKKETAKRYVLAAMGVLIMGIGVAATTRAELGVSPISSVANIMSIKIDAISLGNWLFLWNMLLLVGQMLILRKRFNPIQFLQVPISILFGSFTDIGVKLWNYVPIPNYAAQLIMVIGGMVILSIGITICVTANVIMNSGEAFVKAISDTTHKDFGMLKVVFDVCCVVMAVLLSLLFFGTIVGTREGTIILAVLTGFTVKLLSKFLAAPIEKFAKA